MVDPGLYPLRLVQLGLEGSNGSAVAATSKIEGTCVWTEDDVKFRRAYPTGIRMPDDEGGVTVSRMAGLSIAQPLDYEQILWGLLAGIGDDATPDGGGPYTWQFPAMNQAKPTLKTITAEFATRSVVGGTEIFEREAAFGCCRRLAITITPGEIAQLEMDFFFRASGGSTFTASLAPISGRADVPSSLFNLAIDSSWANLGNTAMDPGFRTATIEIITGILPDFTADQRANLDFTSFLAGQINANVTVTMEHNSQAATEVAAARDNTVRFYRFNADNGAGAGANRDIKIDMALKHLAWPGFTEEDGIDLVTYTLGLEYDSAGGQGLDIEVINGLATQGSL